jgi:hypothetical protein
MPPVADPRYPIGKFTPPATIAPPDRRIAISSIEKMPELLRSALRDLDTMQLNTPYREGGWTIRQVVHHIADSHGEAFHRVRLALTEDWPTVTAYNEKAFASLADSVAPAEWSVELIEAIHARWVLVLNSLTEAHWRRGYKHPERGPSTVEQATMLYAWHSRHHLAHITHLRARKGW